MIFMITYCAVTRYKNKRRPNEKYIRSHKNNRRRDKNYTNMPTKTRHNNKNKNTQKHNIQNKIKKQKSYI